MKHYKLLTCLIVMFAVGFAFAGDGRIEISQADMASPPYIITNSGSYVLTENLLVTNTTSGIDVQVDSVTIDLNGFTLQGSANGYYGILQQSSLRNLTIINGTVSNWKRSEKYGIYVQGVNNQIKNVTACYNDCGIYLGKANVVESCIAVSNSASAWGYGISAGNGATLSYCSVYQNSAVNGCCGIKAGAGSTISDCSAYSNNGSYCTGIQAGDGSTISDCSAYENSAADTTYYGIQAGNGSTISGCSAVGNKSASINGAGIHGGSGSVIVHCSVRKNQNDGIRVNSSCIVLNNTSNDNGDNGDGHGIKALFYHNRIEGNTANNNVGGYGIQTVSSNIVIRNTASGNALGQYNLAVGMHGPIATSMTNHPWANFSFP